MSAFCSELFSGNRQRLTQAMVDSAAVILHAQPKIAANSDALYPYLPGSHLIWATGIAQPDTIFLLLKKDGKAEAHLFIVKPDPLKEIWEGRLLRKEEAAQLSGITQVHYTEDFPRMSHLLLQRVERIYFPLNEHDRRDLKAYYPQKEQLAQLRKDFPLHQLLRLEPIMKPLRMCKNAYEIRLIEAAIAVTDKAFRAVLEHMSPSMNEKDIEALIYQQFIAHHAFPGYDCIIAAGDNARILHYTQNNQPIADGVVVLMDFGARKQYYNADISRTIPSNGAFTKRQEEVYRACLHLHNYAKSLLKPGVLLGDYTKAVGEEAGKVFVAIGLLSDKDVKNGGNEQPAYRKYLYHGISHHLGIDVHDLSEMAHTPLQPGMVLTVEPGIYIEEEQMGVRLENNVLITDTGIRDLSQHIPIAADDIVRLMRRR